MSIQRPGPITEFEDLDVAPEYSWMPSPSREYQVNMGSGHTSPGMSG